ncbi:hypothetical protein [uncultured Lentibacter sp.]|jgi:hypothetical protein|uniref:hypothetical protein n=1 Tax=uncultured Lentibacter sp. TaxID=1659309 RepID=UPI002608A13A|nr:hypothetical protein [uncultured Lentibacter sp.]
MPSHAAALAVFTPNRGTYIREHVLLAALGALLLSALLIALDNPHPWTGVVGSLLAISARGAYAMREQLAMVWTLTETQLIAPDKRVIPLAEVADARHVFSALQVITRTGDKYLIKYQPDPAAGAAQILQTRDAALSGQE